ncbi:MAG: hypothetical protein ABEJ34_02410 [Haloferacaceae archaeon]
MCHHYDRVSWEERADSEEEDADEEWTPDPFSDEPAEDVEVLTDGGDE